MRFHLVDRIDEIYYGKYIKGTKCITLADDVFDQHFPGFPVFPGSLIIESLAQLGGAYFELVMKKESQISKQCVLSIVNKMKFRQGSYPGDCLSIKAEVKAYNEDFGVVYVTAAVDDKVRAEGELTFMFVDIASSELINSRKNLYNILAKNMVVVDENNL